MRQAPDIFEASIVAVGSFNPPIVSVDWLLANGLIGSGDADTARERADYVVTHQITKIQTDALAIQVLENQLSISAVGPVSPSISDFATSILRLLPHTPVSAIGLNFMGHYKMPSIDSYHRVGDTVAPKAIWESIFPEKPVGLINLTISVQEGTREKPGPNPNAKRITIQPSARFKNAVLFQLNDHYGLGIDNESLNVAARAAELVMKNWDSTYAESLRIFEAILQQTSANQN